MTLRLVPPVRCNLFLPGDAFGETFTRLALKSSPWLLLEMDEASLTIDWSKLPGIDQLASQFQLVSSQAISALATLVRPLELRDASMDGRTIHPAPTANSDLQPTPFLATSELLPVSTSLLDSLRSLIDTLMHLHQFPGRRDSYDFCEESNAVMGTRLMRQRDLIYSAVGLRPVLFGTLRWEKVLASEATIRMPSHKNGDNQSEHDLDNMRLADRLHALSLARFTWWQEIVAEFRRDDQPPHEAPSGLFTSTAWGRLVQAVTDWLNCRTYFTSKSAQRRAVALSGSIETTLLGDLTTGIALEKGQEGASQNVGFQSPLNQTIAYFAHCLKVYQRDSWSFSYNAPKQQKTTHDSLVIRAEELLLQAQEQLISLRPAASGSFAPNLQNFIAAAISHLVASSPILILLTGGVFRTCAGKPPGELGPFFCLAPEILAGTLAFQIFGYPPYHFGAGTKSLGTVDDFAISGAMGEIRTQTSVATPRDSGRQPIS